MGKQRAHKRQWKRTQAARKALEAAIQTGFRAPVVANMGVLPIARSARFSCRCGERIVSFAGFPPGVAVRCAGCGAVYRVEHEFDREAFERRTDRDPFRFWPIGQAIELARPPELGPEVPVRLSRNPDFGCHIGGQAIHYEPAVQEGVFGFRKGQGRTRRL
ncbi:MAG TPA: hypothetical protein PK668_20785 [Myxococcota bacterium]|nr:hypothetical protein [Myxococcota bacterium]HRY96652.1 hypothetical protein [Myxococcota bacterium]